MKRFIYFFVLTGLMMMCYPLSALGQSEIPPVNNQPVSMNDAYTVAQNWIAVIIDKYGHWGGFPDASVETITPFRRGDKTVGYFCKVQPKGFILVSMRRELAPVKAYSDRSNLDPEAEEGMTDLLKGQMADILDRFERLMAAQAGGQGRHPVFDGLPAEMEIDYRIEWNLLERDPLRFMDESLRPVEPAREPDTEDKIDTGDDVGDEANYQEGEVLLTSAWHQGEPYNNHCPLLGCTSPANGRALVGCVATAGAQIMRYWAWPPWGVESPYDDMYDWPNMPDTATNVSPRAVQDAVAELSREIGLAVGMNYGCDSSSSKTYKMEWVYEDHYRYSNVIRRSRSSYSAGSWFDMMKTEFNNNRPVQYRITDHSIVGDGWQEIGSTRFRQYHMNYGWGGPSNAWYTLDSLTSDPESEEYLLLNIMPVSYLISLSGTYSRLSFPYRYFYRDTSGSGGTFAGGQRLQFLPGVFVYGTGSSAAPVTFQGSASYYSYLFTRGDHGRGIRIYKNADAAIKLFNGGGFRFH